MKKWVEQILRSARMIGGATLGAGSTGFRDCSGPEKVLLYSALVPVLVRTHGQYALAYDSLVYREFFWVAVLFLALGAWWVESWRGHTEFPLPGAGLSNRWPLLAGGLFLYWTLLSVFWSPGEFWAWHSSAGWFVYLVFLWLLSGAMRREHFRNLYLAVVLIGLGLLSTINLYRFFAQGYRMEGFIDLHPCLGAEVLATFLPVAAGLFLFHSHPAWRGIGLISFFLFYWAMLQTARRSPFIGWVAGTLFAGAVLVFVYIQERRRRPVPPGQTGSRPRVFKTEGSDVAADEAVRAPVRAAALFSEGHILNQTFWRRLGLLMLLAATLTCAQLTPSLLNGMGREQYNLAGRLQPQEIMSVGNRMRLQNWAACYEMVRENPLAGVGAGNFRPLYRHYRALYYRAGLPFGYFCNDEDQVPDRAHSEYFQVLGELGAVGMALFLFFIAASLVFPLKQIVAILRKAGHGLPIRSPAVELRKIQGSLGIPPSHLQVQNALIALSALAGMVSFFVSSGASSFGFRFSVSAWGFCVVFALAMGLLGAEEARVMRQEPEVGSLKIRNPKSEIRNPKFILGCAVLLMVTGLIAFASLRLLVADLYYWKYELGRGRNLADAESALAWFPQNPGTHLILATEKLFRLLQLRKTVEQALGSFGGPDAGGTSPNQRGSPPGDQTLRQQAVLSPAIRGARIEDILYHFDAAYRNGLCVSLIPAFKALTAEMVLKPGLAHSILEDALAEFPDSPFLAAYYSHLSRSRLQDEAAIRQRIHPVIQYQPRAFRLWQTYFDDRKEAVDARFAQYPSLSENLIQFHRFYREIRER